MANSTYGLGGMGLTGFGQGQKQDAMNALGKAADMEQTRKLKNEQANQARKAGNAQLGSTLGTMGGMALGAEFGMVGGPMGALIGGVVGALAGSLF
jgi:hypothetical protein